MNDIQNLAENTHLTENEAEILLEDRILTGNPRNHDRPEILITKDEIIVETTGLFSNSDTLTDVELAFKSDSKVQTIRGD